MVSESTKLSAEESVEKTYQTIVADLQGCTLYGLKLEEFENPEHAKVVATYFMQFATKLSEEHKV